MENGEQVDISFGKQALADEGILGTANAQLMEWDVRVTNDGYKYVELHTLGFEFNHMALSS